MRLAIHQLGSGSSGNATLVHGPQGALLIDAGFSARETMRRAEACGVPAEELRAVLLTHSHSDHAKGAAVLARRHGVPVWGTAPTLGRVTNLRGGEELYELPRRGKVEIAGVECEVLPVSHDAEGTVIVRVEERIGVATDLGIADRSVRRFLSGLEVLLLEFNHDREMLLSGDYPPWLQDRILADEGHLSNAQAAALLVASDFEPPTRALFLCHLSRENNDPDLALAAAEEALAGRGTEIHLTRQDEPATAVVLDG